MVGYLLYYTQTVCIFSQQSWDWELFQEGTPVFHTSFKWTASLANNIHSNGLQLPPLNTSGHKLLM